MKFSEIKLQNKMLKNLESLGFTNMTEIQEKSLPVTLEGKDVIAKSKTGSGKTIAFGIPLLQNLDVKKFSPQALILAPTRELADQVATELRKLAKFKHNIKILTLCGGMPMRDQMNSLFHGAHVVVGTPGRIDDHIGKKTLVLKDIDTVVLDEADRMLDMGFIDSIEKILQNVPKKRQTMLFSATFDENIKTLSNKITNNPQSIEIEQSSNNKNIQEIFYTIQKEHKFDTLVKLLRHYKPESVIIFCNMKVTVTELTDDLHDEGFDSIDLQGDLEQRDRTEALLQFANRSRTILVATDVAARGLDIKGVDTIINYDLPRDKDQYIHRIGRTGRAGHSGLALSLIAPRQKQELCPNPQNKESKSLEVDDKITLSAPMQTICINGGKKHKLRAGDILGVLCQKAELEKNDIGKINLFDFYTYVAVKKEHVNKALLGIKENKIKKRTFKAYKI